MNTKNKDAAPIGKSPTQAAKEDQKKLNEMVPAPKKEVAAAQEDYGVADELTNEDCERGRISLMQPTSTLVKDEQVKAGSFINLSDSKVLGYKTEKPLEIIPFGSVKYWIESDADTRDFIAKYPGNHDKEFAWDDVRDGRAIKRLYHFSYIVILPGEVATMEAMPYEMAFKSTHLATSKKINAILKKMRRNNLSSWDKTFKITSVMKSKGKDSWYVPEVTVGRDTTPEEKEVAKEYRAEFMDMKAKILSEQQAFDTNVTNETEY